MIKFVGDFGLSQRFGFFGDVEIVGGNLEVHGLVNS